MSQAALIILHGVQIGETQRCTSNLLQNSKREEHQIENANSKVEFRQRSQEFEPQLGVVLELVDLMQQYTFDVLIQEEEERLNMSKREEVVPRYRSTSHFYYRDGQENKEFKQRVHNFEPMIHYVIEQEAATQGIKMSRGIELVLVTR